MENILKDLVTADIDNNTKIAMIFILIIQVRMFSLEGFLVIETNL